MEMHLRKLAFTALIVLFSMSLRAADDPFVGLWKVNVAKSKYESPPPQFNTFQYEPAGNGWLKVTNTTVDSKGNRNVHDRIETYDGKPHPVVNDPGAEEVLVKRIDPHTIQGSNWKQGKIVTRFTRVVSTDGKTHTTTVDGVNAQGKQYHDVRVFERQ